MQTPGSPTTAGIFPNYTTSQYDAILAVRSTDLRTLENECPAILKYQRENPEDKMEFDIGRAAHLLYLEPHLFEESIVRVPFGDYKTNDAKQMREEAYDADRTPLNFKQIELVMAMRDAFQADADVQQIMNGCKFEQTLIWQDKETGLWCKARPDGLSEKYLLEAKTAASCKPSDFSMALGEHGYFMQAAWCIEGWKAVTGGDFIDLVYLVQRKKPPHLVMPFRPTQEAIMQGMERNRTNLRTLARCMEKNDWHKYREPHQPHQNGVISVGLKSWKMMQLEEKSEMESLA